MICGILDTEESRLRFVVTADVKTRDLGHGRGFIGKVSLLKSAIIDKKVLHKFRYLVLYSIKI